MNIEVRTQKGNNKPQYSTNLCDVITFLGHPEDKIRVKEGEELLEIQIYHNDELLFSGDKYELFNKLK